MEAILPKLLELGPPGLLCAVLAYAWITAEKRNDKLLARIEELHDSFVASAKETVKHIENNTSILTALRTIQEQREDNRLDVRARLDEIQRQIKSWRGGRRKSAPK
jgi:hypothetical protein